MRYVNANDEYIVLGRQGENHVVTVQFDVTGWAEEYGVGEFLLFNERSKDKTAYPCTVTQTGNRLDWVIESADVYYSGYGRVQLTYIVNNAVAKSVIYYTVVLPSLDAGDSPTPTPEWIQDVLNYRLDSEAYALGTKNGVDVPDTDPTYHNNAKYYSDVRGDLEPKFNGEIFVGSPALTERVEGGTLIKNQVWANKCAAIVGFAYDAESNKVSLYGILGSLNPPDGSRKTYRLINKDDLGDPYELTLENAPTATQFTSDTAFYKFRANVSDVVDHFDYRLCRVLYDRNGQEIERIYSAQYRYTVSNGTVSRTWFNVADTDATHIVDIGLVKSLYSILDTFNIEDTVRGTLYPLVSTFQDLEYKFIVPDSMFEDAPNGLSICVVNGIGHHFMSSNFGKAEDELGKIGNLLISKGLITQEEWDER